MKFTFICEDDPMPFSEGVVTKRTVEFNGITINSVLEEFEMFMRGCGFYVNGHIDIVNDEFYESDDLIEDSGDSFQEMYKKATSSEIDFEQ